MRLIASRTTRLTWTRALLRLLLDDNNTAGMDAALAALDAHANIEVRLFNPYAMRSLRFGSRLKVKRGRWPCPRAPPSSLRAYFSAQRLCSSAVVPGSTMK